MPQALPLTSASLTSVDDPAPPQRRPYLVLLRPKQWVKNVAILVLPLIGGGVTILEHPLELAATGLAFCLAASAIYVLNDIVDRDRDRAHATKRYRPVASGQVNLTAASALAVGAGVAALSIAGVVSWSVLAYVLTYLGINVAYCLRLKHVPVFDIVAVSTGFMLRALAGATAAGVFPNGLLLGSLAGGSFALVVAKRRAELATTVAATSTRPALRGSSIESLDAGGAAAAVCSAALYLIYLGPTATTHAQSAVFGMIALLVLAGLLRYLQISMHGNRAENPTRVLRSDRGLLLVMSAWVVCSIVLGVLRHVGL